MKREQHYIQLKPVAQALHGHQFQKGAIGRKKTQKGASVPKGHWPKGG